MSDFQLVCDEHAPKPDATAQELGDKMVGGFAKLPFPCLIMGKPSLEHMWIKVCAVEDGTISGTLDNDPVFAEMTYGQEVKLPLNLVEGYLPPKKGK